MRNIESRDKHRELPTTRKRSDRYPLRIIGPGDATGAGRSAVPSGDRVQSGADQPHADAPAPAPASDEGRDSRQSKVARVRVLGASGFVIAAAIFAILALEHAPFGDPRLLLPFVAMQAVSWAVAIYLQPHDSKFVQQFDEAAFVAGVLLLPSAGVVVVLGCGTALG